MSNSSSKLPVSQRKLAANRANSQKSTGSQTEAGRAAVAENRTSHGLCGRFCVLANKNQAGYDELLADFLDAEQPVDAVERELVAKTARHTWLSERAQDDGTNDLLVSDVIRTNEAQAWFVSEHVVDMPLVRASK